MTLRIWLHCKSPLALLLAAACLFQATAICAGAYTIGSTVPDMRQSPLQSGDTACPQPTRFDIAEPINRQWSTALAANPASILTVDRSADGQLNEIENTIQGALNAWTNVSGSSLTPAILGPLQRTDAAIACSSSDGMNSICFNQVDPAFTLGVLAFTRVVSADIAGERLSPSARPSRFAGQILDSDILVRGADPHTTFATPAALPANPNAYDLQSILTHELGHSFGFGHSGVWGSMMFPIAPPPGQFTGLRPTTQSPDAPLSDDDRTGLRVLYPDAADTLHVGSIAGHVLPASSSMLPDAPAGITGIFPAQVVALDGATGAVAAAVMAGWSCGDPGPAKFDGGFLLQHLAVGAAQSYQIYAEPLDGPVTLSNVLYNTASLCRNTDSDPGWPAAYACTVPPVTIPFSAQIRLAPN
jgi:hypothetical protein